MKRLFGSLLFAALTAAAVSFLMGVALGQCPSCSGTAATIAPLAAPVAVPAYIWRQAPDDSDCWSLFISNTQVGGWRASDNAFRPFFAATRTWGLIQAPPVALPVQPVAKKSECNCSDNCGCGDDCNCRLGKPCCNSCRCIVAGKKSGVRNYGVVEEKRRHGERYMRGGNVATRSEVIQAMTEGPHSIPDDRAKPSLTFCGGTDAERKAAVATAKKAGLDQTCLIQDYPDDSPLLDPGFMVPSTYMQTAAGKVIARVPRVVNEIELAAVRKADPAYTPAKDPDPTKPALLPGLPSLEDLEKKLQDVPTWAWIAGAIALYLYWKKSQTPPPAAATVLKPA